MTVEYIVVSAPRYEDSRYPSEDAHVVSEAGGGRPFFAVVADGHGNEVREDGAGLKKSKKVAAFARGVADGIASHFHAFPDPSLFPDHFDATAELLDGEFVPLVEQEHEFAQLSVGSTATALVLLGTVAHLAHVGDSRFYRSEPVRGYRRLTNDHTITYPLERQRLLPFSSGPRSTFSLVNDRDKREGGWSDGLAPRPPRLVITDREHDHHGEYVVPTRGFGDYEFHPAVTHEPELYEIDLAQFDPGTLYALCTDGGNRYVERTFKYFRGRHAEVTLEELRDDVLRRLGKHPDDVTIIFLRVVD